MARKISIRNAGKRYQNTRKGKHKHAERQKQYLARIKKMTHQGSINLSTCDLLSHEISEQRQKGLNSKYLCHFCCNLCSPFLRMGFMNQRASNGKKNHSILALGP